jgi:putative hemolysin
MPGDPFQIDTASLTPVRRAAIAAARPLLSWLLGLRTYQTLYEMTQSNRAEPFERRALQALDIQLRVSDENAALIPPRGPVLIVSNHPHGALDGLVLAAAVRRRRSDVRILANHLLSRIPELAELCFFVDPFGGPIATARSQAGLRAAHLWLRNGGALVVFPSGEVAHKPGPQGSRVDSPWRSTTGRMVLTTGAPVLPAFIEGTNTRLFYAVGRVHPVLRTVLLVRELLNKRGQAVTVRLGAPLAARSLAGAAADATSATEAIRRAVEQLGQTAHASPESTPKAHDVSSLNRTNAIPSEIVQLPSESCLLESGAFQVFLAEASQIPETLLEIGRLREVTYRAIGEGTGRQLDLDAFDDRYLHLFSWDRERKQIVGAYRIGRTDRIIATDGVDGLYTRTLFRYDERLIAHISPALELGRSFVRAEYQKNYNALLLLWKGIGQFVARHPQYRVLFGPVSISSQYSDSSHRLLMAFLQQNHLDRDLADLVEALNPCLVNPAPAPAAPRSVDEANRLVAEAEADGKGVPILLRQYLKLNAKVLGFNVDPQFGEALDALMMVNLTTVDAAILNRYLGRQEAAEFLARHRAVQSAQAA